MSKPGVIPGLTSWGANRHAAILIFFTIVSIGLCRLGHAETVRIVVTGDGRADYPWNDERRGDKDGINEEITKQIAATMAAEDPQIMLWTGDIVNVNERVGVSPADKTNFLPCERTSHRPAVIHVICSFA